MWNDFPVLVSARAPPGLHESGEGAQLLLGRTWPHGTNGDRTASGQGLDTYRELFSGVTNEIAIGEASVSYMHFPGTARRIREHVPGAKLIAILRDPIDRAYSQFLMFRRLGVETLTDFDEALQTECVGQHRHYLDAGRYLTQLQRYLEHFPREQLEVHLYDDLRADAGRLAREVFRFLGVDEHFPVDANRRYSEAVVLRSRRAQALFDHTPSPISSAARLLVSRRFRRRAYWRLRAWNSRPAPSMPPGIRRQYVPLFREEILALQDLIGRDLSAWLVTTDP